MACTDDCGQDLGACCFVTEAQILSGGNSTYESEKSIPNDRRPAHPRRLNILCTGWVACHLHSAGFAQPTMACPCRSFRCTGDGQFGPQTVAWGHGHVASLDWLYFSHSLGVLL